MKYLLLPDPATVRPLAFYLAMEEWAARHLAQEPELFFLWQVPATVICGRNQQIDKEVDLEYCRREGIDVVRRKSGGGAVFADMRNVMMSYIVSADDVVHTFRGFTGSMVALLRSLGADADASERNDILIGGRKVSGNSYYHIPGRSIVHGTMLFDTDFRHLEKALTPSRAKLESKGVKSTAARVTTLSRELPALTIDRFREAVRKGMCTADVHLTDTNVAEISELARAYQRPEWLYGVSHRYATPGLRRHAHIPGVGEICASIIVDTGVVRDMDLTGDFFVLGDLDAGLLARLRGARWTADGVRAALADTDPSACIAGLTLPRLLTFLFPEE